jgi:hypothetical protein
MNSWNIKIKAAKFIFTTEPPSTVHSVSKSSLKHPPGSRNLNLSGFCTAERGIPNVDCDFGIFPINANNSLKVHASGNMLKISAPSQIVTASASARVQTIKSNKYNVHDTIDKKTNHKIEA